MWRDLYSLTYRHLRRRGVPHADAEDIAQEVLTAAYVSIDSIDPTRIRAWLLAAARNKMIDRYRRTDRFVPLDDTLVVMDPDEGPAGAVLRKQEAQELRRVIAEMSPRDARLLELYYFDERPLADVAEMTGTSTMAAKVALFRARRRLRRALETGEAR